MGVASCHLSNILISPIHFGSKYLNNYFFKVGSVLIFPLNKPHFMNSRRFLCVGNPERWVILSIPSLSQIPFHSTPLVFPDRTIILQQPRARSLSAGGSFLLFPVSPNFSHFSALPSKYLLLHFT